MVNKTIENLELLLHCSDANAEYSIDANAHMIMLGATAVLVIPDESLRAIDEQPLVFDLHDRERLCAQERWVVELQRQNNLLFQLCQDMFKSLPLDRQAGIKDKMNEFIANKKDKEEGQP